MSVTFDLNGARLHAEPDGSLWWPAERTLVVADLHLEKGSSFARRGRPLPPYDTRATLERLRLAIERHRPARVISLGDAFHDKQAAQRMPGDDRALLLQLAKDRDWIWIAGNHEAGAVPFGSSIAQWRCGPLVFRHEPQPDFISGEVAGHWHPKATVRMHGRKVSRPCFATDGRRLILPAFGVYTGGFDLLTPVLRQMFGEGLLALMLARDVVHAVPAAQLAPAVP